MTAPIDASHHLTLDHALVASAAQTAANDQADAAAHDLASRAVEQARRERRVMAAAWASLVFGLALSLGVFSSIAWENSVAANGVSHSVSTPAP